MSWMLLCPLVLSWTMFCFGAAAEMWRRWGEARGPVVLLVAGAGVPLLARLVWKQSLRWRPRWNKLLERHARQIDSLPMRLDWLWIALGAGLGLYLELAMIRFHGCCFQLFAFFKNLSMLSCFLGLGIGYAISRRRANLLLLTGLRLPLVIAYALLIISIAAQLMISRHGLSPIMATALLTLPMFFAGLAFSADCARPHHFQRR